MIHMVLCSCTPDDTRYAIFSMENAQDRSRVAPRRSRRGRDQTAEATLEVGWRQAMAAPASRAPVEVPSRSATRRAVLRRARSHNGSDAEARAVERHQSARHQLLFVAASRSRGAVVVRD